MKTLIVDDSETNVEVLQMFLKPFGENAVAYDGKEAVADFGQALIDGHPYDLVCLDIMMPEMDGQAALTKIRALERENGIGGLDAAKVVMTTAADTRINVMRAFREQCDGFISKPISKNELLKHLYLLGLLDADMIVRVLLKIEDANS